MGVKHFFIWLRKNFPQALKELNNNERLNVRVDNLCIDMNGVFHPCAQQVYEYGEYKRDIKSLLRPNRPKKTTLKQQLQVFRKLCQRIEYYKNMTNPQKRIILCIDGVAGSAKMSQQRQRRFKSAKEKDSAMVFDPNCMTPGTQFLDYLSKYVDWFVKSKISYDESWADLEVIISSEKVAGEGEHKIISYMRKYSKPFETYCIQGLDADLIMLGLGSPVDQVYILRENIYRKRGFFLLDIKELREGVVKHMRWENTEVQFRRENAINDFLFLCFFVGNDFLPTIPTLAILGGGIDVLINVYKTICNEYGHLTGKKRNGIITFKKKSFKFFLGALAQYEKDLVVEKANKRESFFPDPLVNKNLIKVENGFDINYNKYVNDYYQKKFGEDVKRKKICHEYLYGMQWVITYYKQGIPDWRWHYPYSYGPFIQDLCDNLGKFNSTDFEIHEPVSPFEQLLSVLPPSSKKLIPTPLSNLLNDDSPLKKFYPDEFEIDVSGKRREWEGIVLLPMVNLEEISDYYKKYKGGISFRDMKRNMPGKSFIYTRGYASYYFKSFYGDVPKCNVRIRDIEL